MAGGTPLGNMRIKLELDDAQFGRGVENSKKQIKYLAKEMQANMKIADMAGNTQAKLGAKFESLSKIIQAQERQVADLKREYDESFVKGKATDSTKRLAAELQNANGKLANYRTQLINTAGAMAEWQVKNEGLTGAIYKNSERLISAGDKMSNLGGKLTTGLTLPIAGAAVAVGKAAIDWESAFAGVKKTNDEVVDSNGKVVYSYSDLENGLRDLAKELPSSHQEIAAVAEAAGQLGIKTENVKSFTKTMIDMGESTNLSAETASTELARFANIVGMSQDKFSNLGSAIVDLGNNYATTEAEISSMALRLAGAGKQIGMSEGDILGFSAALSSVGIEAEAGGSAFSKVMVQMQLATEKGVGSFEELKGHAADQGVSWERLVIAVRNGGKELTDVSKEMGFTSSELKKMYKEADKSKTSLEQFSDVAGMTGEQFAKLFKEDPSTAIMKFVEGLAKAEESGSSAIKVLDDMDIKEVRLRDSLLRAANASGIFGDAIKTGNKAFKDNTALTEEAGKRYETTESKLKMLKNEVVDVAIDMGGPLVDALRDGVEAGKPLIKMLGDAGKAFSDADPKTQRMIVKLLAYTAAAGPVLSVTGKITKGIGTFGQTFVDVSASIAKKKAIAQVTKELAEGAVSAGDFGKVMASGADDVLKFGGAAGTASGAGGLGGMMSVLGPLTPAILGIVGVGGALAIGYGAWKTFGEEAWNSSQRVKEWGVDVGEDVTNTLGTVKSKTEEASGQFGLMASGLATNTDEMAGNFATIGETIEASLIKKIEGLDKLIKELPASVDEATRTMVEDEKEKTESALAEIQNNNDRIAEIRQKASQNNRELSVQEAQIISDLAKDTTKEYVNTLDVSAAEKKKILSAMNADVSKASKDEATLWLQSLAEQRNAAATHAAKGKKEKEQYLKDLGYNLDGEFAQKFLASWDEINKTTEDGFEAQMAMILEKYPELIREVHLGSGQMLKDTNSAASDLIKDNERIMRSHEALAEASAKAAKRNAQNAEKLKVSVKETGTIADDAGRMWNDLVLDDKTGNVKTNAQEAVNEAAKEEKNWNQMMWLAKDADVSSNAKLMIAEAAIANGKWEGLSFTEQQAMLDSNVTKTMTQAVQAKGDWKKLSFDEKKALIYSNTPETMAETMANLGLWDKYQPEIKELGAKNAEFLGVIAKSEEKLGNWNAIPAETKEILGDNYDLLKKLYESDERFNLWKQIPDAQKKILGNNEDLILKITGSEATFNAWKALPETEKKILGNNQDVLMKILSSEENYNRWTGLPEVEKHILGNNGDLLAKVMTSEESINAWNKLPADVKVMLGNNENILEKIKDGSISIDTYNKVIHPALKSLFGDESGVNKAITGAKDVINYYNTNVNALEKKMNASTNAGSLTPDISGLASAWSNVPRDDYKTLTVKRNFIGPVLNAKGTNNHPGGDMIVNDQAGHLYKELIRYPNGVSFIPEGRNVFIPDAPKGTKVYTAAKTKRMVPQYAKGIGVPENSSIVRNLRALNGSEHITTNTIKVEPDYSTLENKLDTVVSVLMDILEARPVVDVNYSKLARNLRPYSDAESARAKLQAKRKAGEIY